MSFSFDIIFLGIVSASDNFDVLMVNSNGDIVSIDNYDSFMGDYMPDTNYYSFTSLNKLYMTSKKRLK